MTIKHQDSFRLLILNSGSTSMKIAIYENEKERFMKTAEYTPEELDRCGSLNGQFDLRLKSVLDGVAEAGRSLSDFSAIVSRGGSTGPMKHCGAYRINEAMARELRDYPRSSHAGNLGPMIAYELCVRQGIAGYIYDSVAVDQLREAARISGLSDIPRVSLVHALNSRYAAKEVARRLGRSYEDLNLIAAHIGGGITLTLHSGGRIIDVVGDDEGPFSPERSGGIPTRQLVDLCYSGKYPSKEDMHKAMRGHGGLMSYLGTTDAREVERRITGGDEKAKLIYDAMFYQIAKGIGQLSTPVCGRLDGIILTGGIAHSEYAMNELIRQVGFLAPVHILPGENEMRALCQGVLEVLRGREAAHEYESCGKEEAQG